MIWTNPDKWAVFIVKLEVTIRHVFLPDSIPFPDT
jgi:hypothetical protein